MPGLEDGIRSHPLATLGVAAAVVAPLAVPSLRRPWAAGLKAVIKLFLEAEAGAEADLIDQFAEAAVGELVDALSHRDPEVRHEAAHAAIRRYTKRARRRAARRGRDEADRQRRYGRHIAALAKRIGRCRTAATTEERRKHWDRVLATLNAEQAPAEAAPTATAQGEASHAVHR